MSESKHTPGPWEARTFLVLGGADLRDRICHVGTSTSLGPSRSQESEANARLIAAAPELFEAASLAMEGIGVLDNLIASIERRGHYSVESTLGFLNQARCARMRLTEAISKAGGQS